MFFYIIGFNMGIKFDLLSIFKVGGGCKKLEFL